MLSPLKFVQGSIAKKDLVPALTHFVIERGMVRGFNGQLALCCPLEIDITCKPKAEPLIKAIANCSDTVQLSMTAAGRLSIKSGKFRANIDCIDGDTPHVEPEGEMFPIDGEAFIAGLQAVAPFIGSDASRPWSNGVLCKGPSMFATNNICVIEYWLGVDAPHTMNIPASAVKEILRIKAPPVSLQSNGRAITLHYPDGRWLRTQLFATDWPNLSKVLDHSSNATSINPQLFEGLTVVKPFADKIERVYFGDGSIATHTVEDEGAGYEVEGLPSGGIYSISMVQLLEGVAKTIDWNLYPEPCLFFGERVRGAIVGMRP